MEEKCFDEKKWSKLIKSPDWYFFLTPEWAKFGELKTKDKELYRECKKQAYDFFEENLVKGNVALAESGTDWDRERKPVDTVVIHHTEEKPGLGKDRLSAIVLIRLYATYYAEPYDDKDRSVKGKPIWSNHMRGGKQVFWPYHWIVRTDGSVERLLNDDEIGWQAGNWDTNCRSVAIVLDNNYESSEPSGVELEVVANIIKENYRFVAKENIIGHREVKRSTKVSKTTTCPSNLFLSTNSEKGWKEKLMTLI